ncbi:phage holin family protein [Luteococcus sp. OSA5]|uniref:phage holin family protein n=1 Tax=Luteococcus sp. OSA5 TaxID=3401630 RepID=UPI003B4315E0
MLIRLVANAIALALATALVPGILIEAGPLPQRVLTIIVVAALFGLLNALVKPVLKFFSFPLVVLTLGLFLWVVNACMLMLTSWAAGLFDQPWQVTGWGAAFIGSLLISLVSGAVAGLLQDKEARR